MTSFDFGEVKDIVDEGKEMLAALVDAGEAIRLEGVEMGLALEDLGVTENAVERGAKFVGHIGEEIAFGLAGDFGFFFGESEFVGTFSDLLR